VLVCARNRKGERGGRKKGSYVTSAFLWGGGGGPPALQKKGGREKVTAFVVRSKGRGGPIASRVRMRGKKGGGGEKGTSGDLFQYQSLGRTECNHFQEEEGGGGGFSHIVNAVLGELCFTSVRERTH